MGCWTSQLDAPTCWHPSDSSRNWLFVRINHFFPPQWRRSGKHPTRKKEGSRARYTTRMSAISALNARWYSADKLTDMTYVNTMSTKAVWHSPLPLLGHFWTSSDIALLHFCHTIHVGEHMTQEEKLFKSLGQNLSAIFFLQ